MVVKQSPDFNVTGTGDALPWTKTMWTDIPFLQGNGKKNKTKAKMLYSETGIYCLFSCEDNTLTVSMQQDLMPLWEEDVAEVFLQPDISQTHYFEYEISPLNYELPLAIFNSGGNLNRWIPFQYPDNRKTRHAVTVQGGEQSPGASVRGWMAEFFIPYTLMEPVLEKLPVSGSTWKGNLYRIDYDHEREETLWALYKNSGNFHECENFGFFHFE
ncbi:MAG: carbohydrate-binding family 9-like protein [Terrimonas sp.]|nr:carbohydrate-binding family 9-like protein [Terrimonas sp.]OJY98025.1 MAG: hypothetical protein BGP13_10210 [Sphingobacteriales bacterium 40-81]